MPETLRRRTPGLPIAGIEPASFSDYPHGMSAVVFTQGCNLRCKYCHNGALIPRGPGTRRARDVLSWLETRVGLLDAVVLSGGEPLLHPELDSFIAKVAEMGFAVKLDTSGMLPQRLMRLLDRGHIDMVSLDIKTLPEHYPQLTGLRSSWRRVARCVQLLRQVPDLEVQYRTTRIAPWADDEVCDTLEAKLDVTLHRQ